MVPDVKSYIIRRSIRLRVDAYSKEEALIKAKKGVDCTPLSDKWS